MVINTVMRRKDSQVDLQKCMVEKVIEISQAEFSALCNGLLEDKDYISKYKDLMRVDNNGITHCLLVLGSDTEDGILINSEGYNYARYSAYIPNIRQSVTLEQFPALESFNKRMIDVTNSIMNQAIASCEESGDPEYRVDINKYNRVGEPAVYPALIDDMLRDLGNVDETILYSDSIDLMLNSKAIDIPFDYSDEDFTDIEILCARHVLWLYGGEGEKMDLSGKAFLNVDFSGKDLNGADFENCKFYHCTFDNASLVNCNLQNALFSNCSLYNVTSEEAELQNARFFSCNLAKAFFTHSNFKEAVLKSCQTTSSSFMNCCIENIALEETDLPNDKMVDSELDWIKNDIPDFEPNM